MSKPRPRIAPVAVLAVSVAVAVSLLPSVGSGASSGTVVGATVPSAISLQDGCVASAARSFGTILPGAVAMTSTGAGVCRYTFSSSNSSSMLRLYQADRTTQAMVGRPTSWASRSGGGSPQDLAHAGPTLLVSQDAWAGDGRFIRSLDGGATWSSFIPGGGGTPQVATPSNSVAWRFGDGVVQRSIDMQAPTPSWTSINANLQGGGVVQPLDADAVNSTVAWATGYAGIFRTGDAGATNWTVTGSPCTNPDRIDATSSSTAFVVGWGRICRSADSNASWTEEMTGLPADFVAADVQGSPQTATTIWTVGDRGRVARSTDNGATWTAVTSTPIPAGLITLDVLSDAVAYVAGWDGLVFRTIDSGVSWTRYRVPVTGPIMSMAAASASSLVVAPHASGPRATPDTGVTWVVPIGSGDAYRDLDAIDQNVLIAAVGNGKVAVSTDGGVNMTFRDTGLGLRNVRGVAMLDADSFLAVGDQGTIARTDDAGVTWIQRSSGTTEDLWDVDVTSEGVAVAVGAGGTILRSADDGWNWTTRSSTGSDLRRIDARSGAPVIAVGVNGAIRRSADAGVTWTTPVSPTTGTLDSVAVASDLVMYAAHTGTLVKSVDGGVTWTQQGIGGMSRVESVSPNIVWLTAGYIGGWQEWANYSTDGGATWVNAWSNNNPDVSALHMLDDGRIYFGGSGGLLRSTDPPTTVADYAGGAWAGAGSAFGACLQDLTGSAVAATWTEDAGTCSAVDTDAWYAVPTAPVKVAQMAAAGTGTVDIVWGFKAAAGLAPGQYSAGIVVEALAPNL